MKDKGKLFFAATVASALMISGCNNGSTDDAVKAEEAEREYSEEAIGIADDYFAGSRDSFTAWKDIPSDTVIASVDEPEHIPDFDITFGEFSDEYIYYLITGGITDDMSEENAETSKAYRVNLINYLTFEKLFLYVAEHDYGITESSLTDEQLDEVRTSADNVREEWASGFYAAASAELGEDADDEEITDLCAEALDVVLDKCGIDYDIFYKWELSTKLQELCLDEVIKNAAVSDEKLESEYNDLAEQAKNTAETDPTTFENNETYQTLYLPAGTRTARHIMLHYTSAGMDETLRKEAEDAAAKIVQEDGFEELMQQYGGEDTHTVLRNSQAYSEKYVAALYAAEKSGEVCDIVEDNDGVYIIQYMGERVVSEDERSELKEQLSEYLTSNAEQEAQIAAYDEWSSKYSYTVDCDTIKISPEDLIQQTDNYGELMN